MQVAQYCPVAVEIQSQAPVTSSQDPFPLHIESSQSKKRERGSRNKLIYYRPMRGRGKKKRKKREEKKKEKRGTRNKAYKFHN
jgi:hypothetical protein